MKPELRRFGNGQIPVVVIDDFSGSLEYIREIAEELAPYPRHTNNYPGLRRIFTAADTAANAYVEETCERAAQFIADAFDFDGFDLIEASFSMVTLKPTELSPAQRAPHFDTTNQKDLALLHYLRALPNTGTAFYRQRTTGIERVTKSNVSVYAPVADVQLPANLGYFHGSDKFFEEIRRSRGRPGPADHLSRQPDPFRDHSARHAVDWRPASGPADRQHFRSRPLK